MKDISSKANLMLEEIVDKICNLKVMELVQLISILKQKWNVTELDVDTMNVSKKTKTKVEEKKNTYEVVLLEMGKNKINVIKEVRNVLSLGLKESKDFIEKLPKTIKSKLELHEAEQLRDKFIKIGASVELNNNE